jgi:stearoyl-CoA desaturase (delta-9 desaturase)
MMVVMAFGRSITTRVLDTPGGLGACAVEPVPLSVRLAVLGVVLVPLLGLAAAVVLLWGAPFYWTYAGLLIVMYTLSSVGIGVGYHRHFTHKSFETTPAVRYILAVLGSFAAEGPVIKWVASHRMHHQHADQPGDPHSPHVAGISHTGAGSHDDHDPHDHHDHRGVLSVLRGFWHAHIGWFAEPDPPNLLRYVPDLVKEREVVAADRSFLLWVVISLLLPAVLGGVLTQSWWGVLLGFLWGGLVRVFLVHHVTWSVNSVCHLWGTRPYATRDQSRDNPILGVLAFGEGWHNAHHAFPTSARHGLKWWKLDINYLTIRALAALGLAWNIRVPDKQRLRERVRGADEHASTPTPTAR